MNGVDLNGVVQNDSDQNGRLADNGIQSDMDPLEYEFLQQQANLGDIGENGRLSNSIGVSGNSLSGSRSSLVCQILFI